MMQIEVFFAPRYVTSRSEGSVLLISRHGNRD